MAEAQDEIQKTQSARGVALGGTLTAGARHGLLNVGGAFVAYASGRPLAGARLWPKLTDSSEPHVLFADPAEQLAVLFVASDERGQFPPLYVREGEAFDLVLTDAAGEFLLRQSASPAEQH